MTTTNAAHKTPYWLAVLGESVPDQIVYEYNLADGSPEGLDEWLVNCEAACEAGSEGTARLEGRKAALEALSKAIRGAVLLTAVWIGGDLVVDDAAGGRWFPGDEADDMITDSTDPEAEAVRLALEEPCLGVWRS